MAGLKLKFVTGEVALSAATAKTVLQVIAATNHRIKVKRWKVTLDGIAPTDPAVVVTLMRQTTAIGGSPTTITGKKMEPAAAETVQTTAAASAGGSEPTSSDILDQVDVHPQGGYEDVRDHGEEYIVAGGARLGWVLTAPNAVNALVVAEIEE